MDILFYKNKHLCLYLDKPKHFLNCPAEGVPLEFTVSHLPRPASSLAFSSLSGGGGSANPHASGPQTSEVVIMWNVLAQHELSSRTCSTILYYKDETKREE